MKRRHKKNKIPKVPAGLKQETVTIINEQKIENKDNKATIYSKKAIPWYFEYGYNHNPFSIKPGFSNTLIGMEKILSRLTYQVKIGNIICLEGPVGSGKTAILKYLRNQHSKNTLYYNAASKVSLKDAIFDKRPLMQKVLNLRPKELILFLDEADLLKTEDYDFLYEYYVMERVKSIVFATASFTDIPFNESFKADTKVYKLQTIRQNLAHELLSLRLPKQKLISSSLAGKVYSLSDANPRQYLANLEDIFKYAYEHDIKTMTYPMIQEILKK